MRIDLKKLWKNSATCLVATLLLSCGGGIGNLGGGVDGGSVGGGGLSDIHTTMAVNGANGSTPFQLPQDGVLMPGPSELALKVRLPAPKLPPNVDATTATMKSAEFSDTSTAPDSSARGTLGDANVGDLNVATAEFDGGPFFGNPAYVMITRSDGSFIDQVRPQGFFRDPKATDGFGDAIIQVERGLDTGCGITYTVWACWIGTNGRYWQSQNLQVVCPKGSTGHPYGTNPGDIDTTLYLKPATAAACPNPPPVLQEISTDSIDISS